MSEYRLAVRLSGTWEFFTPDGSGPARSISDAGTHTLSLAYPHLPRHSGPIHALVSKEHHKGLPLGGELGLPAAWLQGWRRQLLNGQPPFGFSCGKRAGQKKADPSPRNAGLRLTEHYTAGCARIDNRAWVLSERCRDQNSWRASNPNGLQSFSSDARMGRNYLHTAFN